MLTKEERGAIAERIKSVDYVDEKTFYESIVGKCVPSTTSYTEDLKTIFRVVLDLCDTSNMIELPLDKDGQVIQVGDTVYIGDGIKYEVAGYMMRGNDTEVILAAGTEPVYTKEPANDITHKKPVTIASLVERMRDVLDDDDDMTAWVFSELSHIADQLESLGDSDD